MPKLDISSCSQIIVLLCSLHACMNINTNVCMHACTCQNHQVKLSTLNQQAGNNDIYELTIFVNSQFLSAGAWVNANLIWWSITTKSGRTKSGRKCHWNIPRVASAMCSIIFNYTATHKAKWKEQWHISKRIRLHLRIAIKFQLLMPDNARPHEQHGVQKLKQPWT